MANSLSDIYTLFSKINCKKINGSFILLKPILLLKAIADASAGQGRLKSFYEWNNLISEINSKFSLGLTNIHYPFWRLRNDYIWEVESADNLKKLENKSGDVSIQHFNKQNPSAGLTQDVFQKLQSDSNFSKSIYNLIAQSFNVPIKVCQNISSELSMDNMDMTDNLKQEQDLIKNYSETEYTTVKGKVLKGYILPIKTKELALKVDPYTFPKTDGFFIRTKYIKNFDITIADLLESAETIDFKKFSNLKNCTLDIIEHKTAKGKVLVGSVIEGFTKEELSKIDPYTFYKSKGFFVRQKALEKIASELNITLTEPKHGALESNKNHKSASVKIEELIRKSDKGGIALSSIVDSLNNDMHEQTIYKSIKKNQNIYRLDKGVYGIIGSQLTQEELIDIIEIIECYLVTGPKTEQFILEKISQIKSPITECLLKDILQKFPNSMVLRGGFFKLSNVRLEKVERLFNEFKNSMHTPHLTKVQRLIFNEIVKESNDVDLSELFSDLNF
ncbi:hypothetical protein [Thalassomonas sp. M1454]|uniref:hypothetical protein n=1 Tax=Thalassomonas sp. M1454 TaxID=2594477 RepID=UPI001180DBDC|nr:hypothetical protein [Thalassomonas sp. M1454]TRX56686.1 hypothetical protein FNN08_03930 [Thalassomonas sp. M1454]